MNKTNNILVVEDEIVNIEIYKELLDSKYTLIITENGKDAKMVMHNNPPDIVLLDVMLPDCYGIDLCREIKSDDDLKHIPIIIVTTINNQEDKIKALAAGANDYLNKPINKMELYLKIKNHLTIKNLSDVVTSTFKNIISINNTSDLIMKKFDPNYFDFQKDVFNLLNDYISQIQNYDEIPGFIMIAEYHKETALYANLYKIEENKTITKFKPILLDNFNNFAISEGKNDAVFNNYKDLNTTLEEFQNNFHPIVRKNIGTIYNYICYQGRKIFIIAFNYKTDITNLLAQTLKSFSLTGNFFKIIQDQITEIKDAYVYALNSLARAAEVSDELTGAHIIRVNHYSTFIAEKLHLPELLVFNISNSAQMHDIGKIHIHSDILLKKEKLTEKEWEQIKKHPAYGAKILGVSKFMEVANKICLGHHENYDGSGYPYGRKKEEIPIEARIVHLADVYDSLRSARSYKIAFEHKKVYDIIVNGDGRTIPEHFDPDVLDVFKKYDSEFKQIYETLVIED